MTTSLDGSVAVVAGGARGIGRATALRLAERGDPGGRSGDALSAE